MTVTPKVLVIENPNDDPTVLAIGDVEVIETSSYATSEFCDPQERKGYGSCYADLAAKFPVDSEPYAMLMQLQLDLEERLEQDSQA